MSKITLKKRQAALAYIRAIKPKEKRLFAQAYFNWLSEKVPISKNYKIKNMTKQLVIMKLTDLLRV